MSGSLEILDQQAVDTNLSLANPFPGLRPFSVEESHLFFGREGQSDEVLLKLSRNKFVAVIGASGSGKSSFMYCGVIPILYGGFMADANSNWNVIVTRPGGGPIENLTESLLNSNVDYVVAEGEEKKLRKTITSTLLRSSSLGLIEAVKQLNLASNQNVLIVVDQFEELFRFKKSEDGRDAINESLAFINLLLEAIEASEVPVYVAITMRSDFIGDCAQFPELTKLINDSHYLIPQMVREQKRLAIEGPVAVGGASIASRLVQQLLNDLGDNPDQLPIMQHALMRTWSYWATNHSENEVLDLRHYEGIGSMSGALSQHADEAFDELTEKEKEICESMFKALTEKGSDSLGIRRPTKLSVIASIAGVSNEAVIDVVNRFRGEGRSLLMPPATVTLGPDSVIDISHESLMRIWTRLKKWVEEESESVQMYQRLSEASAMYQIGKGGMWRPPDLQLALNWQAKNKPTLLWAQRYDQAYERAVVFLETSKQEHESELRIKEMMQKRTLKRARIIALVLGAAAIISIGFLVYSIFQKLEADKQRMEAEKQQKLAELNEKEAVRQKKEALHQKVIAEQQTIYAKAQKDTAQQQRVIAQENEKEALRQKIIAEEQTQLAVKNEKEAQRQQLLAQASEKEANLQRGFAEENANKAYRLRLLSIAQSMAVKSLQIEDTMRRAVIAQQAYEFHVKNGGKKYNHDIYDGLYYALKNLSPEEYNSLKGHNNAVRSILFSSNGKTLFTAGSDGKVLRWDMTKPDESSKVVLSNARVNRVIALSKNDQWLSIGGDGNNIQVVDVTKPDPLQPLLLKGHKGSVYSMAFLPDNKLVTTAADSAVFVWDIVSGQYTQMAKGSSRFKSLAVSSDGRLIAGGNEKGQLLVWDRDKNNEETILYTTKAKIIHTVTFSNDGKYIAFGDEAGVVRIWDVAQHKIYVTLAGQKSRINDIKFSKDDRYLASASFDASVRMYDMNDLDEQPLVLKDHNTWVWSLAFSPDDNQLVAGCVDNLIRVWPTSIDLMASQMCDKMKRNMTGRDWNRYVAPDIPYELTCPSLPSSEFIKED